MGEISANLIVIISVIIIFVCGCNLLWIMDLRIKKYIANVKEKRKEQKHNRKLNEFIEKKRRRYITKKKKELILKKAQIKNSIKEFIINKPRIQLDIIAVCIVICTLGIMGCNHTLISNSIKQTIIDPLTKISLVILLLGTLRMIKNKNDNIINFFGIIIIMIYLLLIGKKAFLVSVQMKVGTDMQLIKWCLILLAAAYFIFVIITRNCNWILQLMATILLYIIIIAVGSMVFGAYLINHYPKEYTQQILAINSSKETMHSIGLIIKEGIRYFFTFPTKEVINKVNLVQFFMGKISDMVFLGAIINIIREKIPNDTEKNTQIKDRAE